MSLHHSSETHKTLIDRVPSVTGSDLPTWFGRLESGPGLLRFEERVTWLRDEHSLPHAFASAIVHEQDLRRGALRTQS
jgi:hypothetical protein